MKYLLDTHTFLWYFEDSEKLSETTASIIEDTSVQKYVSIASLWEFSVKYSMGKLRFDGGLAHLWQMGSKNGFTILPIMLPHLVGIIPLPFIHRDPFDRLLIAVATADDMTLLTADENIRKYDVPTVW
jgi:PIN domain nuclease of toxin-antitoxin system